MKETLKLRRKAKQGNATALLKLKAKSVKLATRANKMLDMLAKHGMTKQAYRSAQTFTKPAYSSDRYSTDLTDVDSMYQQLLSIEHFLSLETSTISGSQRVEKDRIAKFKEHYARARKMKRSEILDFFRFLEDDSISAFLDEAGYYESDREVDDFLHYIRDVGRSQDQIISAVELYYETRDNELYSEDEKFYYDDLLDYLNGGIEYKLEGKKVVITRNGRKP